LEKFCKYISKKKKDSFFPNDFFCKSFQTKNSLEDVQQSSSDNIQGGNVASFFEWCRSALEFMKAGEKKTLEFEQEGLASNGTRIEVTIFKGATLKPKEGAAEGKNKECWKKKLWLSYFFPSTAVLRAYF